ncbi:MAG: pentapeptide repeat-containing protein [Xenococcaceae cyanobacterium MO_167.B27]|nr:pentapeptide repeat-containing protein [Xenococcaceae cyanobacterium MO_167.B27]
MKASEVLKRYAAGKRNFKGVNLRGQSFRGKNLSGADFSGADFSKAQLQGTKFTGANLTGANFTGAKCGRTIFSPIVWFWLIGFFYILFNLLLIVAIRNFVKLLYFNNTWVNWLSLIFWLLALFIVIFIALKKLDKVLVKEEEVSGVIVMGFSSVGAGTLIVLIILAIIDYFTSYTLQSDVETLIFYGTVFGSLIIFSIATSAVIIKFVQEILSEKIIILILLAINSMIIALIAKIIAIGIVPLVLSGIILLTTIYRGWNVAKDMKRESWLRFFAIAVACWDGTSFYKADLTDAIFTEAKLKNADFRKANLTGVCWSEAKMLDQALIKNTYLDNLSLLQLLITGEGQNKNFDRQDLRGINLQKANLTDASFIKADLSGANLKGANLSKAKLVQTRLDRTNLTGATLTGAFIEDWGITSSTVFHGVGCKWVFMRLPPEKRPSWLALPVEQNLDDNRRRKPDNWDDKFEGNDFADFIQPMRDTLDLYHNQGVDPRAIAISWKQLEENNPEANLRFASMEVKGENNLLLRLKTDPNANLSSYAKLIR